MLLSYLNRHPATVFFGQVSVHCRWEASSSFHQGSTTGTGTRAEPRKDGSRELWFRSYPALSLAELCPRYLASLIALTELAICLSPLILAAVVLALDVAATKGSARRVLLYSTTLMHTLGAYS